MDINKMHTVFRTHGQQMGMQLIRAILPESIDVYINDAINEKARSIVKDNASIAFQDKVAVQHNPISPINSLRTLYKNHPIDIEPKLENDEGYIIDLDIERVMYYTSFSVNYANGKKRIGCRLIEGDDLYDTMRDYCNRASWDDPIISMFSNDDDSEYVELYTDDNFRIATTLNVKFIQLPDVVKWDKDPTKRVDCNLPEYLHDEIVKLAVNKFFNSVNSTTK